VIVFDEMLRWLCVPAVRAQHAAAGRRHFSLRAAVSRNSVAVLDECRRQRLQRCAHASEKASPAKPPAKPAGQEFDPAAARSMLTALGKHLWPAESTPENQGTKQRVVLSVVRACAQCCVHPLPCSLPLHPLTQNLPTLLSLGCH